MDRAPVAQAKRRRRPHRRRAPDQIGIDLLLEPLEVLYEAADLPAFDLPPALQELYGGRLGFDEPRVFANFVSTLDGVVAIPSLVQANKLISGDSEWDRFVMGLLRAFADVVLIGAGTLNGSPRGSWTPERAYPPAAADFAELRRRLGRSKAPELAILSGRGSIAPTHPALNAGALVLTSEPGAARLRPRLPARSTTVTLGEETTIDPRRVVEALHERGHRLILSEAGPQGFGALAVAGLVDELFLTLSPLLAGSAEQTSRFALVEGVDLLPLRVEGRLLGLRRQGAHLFLRSELKRLRPHRGSAYAAEPAVSAATAASPAPTSAIAVSAQLAADVDGGICEDRNPSPAHRRDASLGSPDSRNGTRKE